MTAPRRPWINTRSGVAINPLDAAEEEIRFSDIAWSLANLCRFAGHTASFYSVAQHSVIVSHIVEACGGKPEEVRAALLHDATEAYIIDLPRPIKHAPEMQPYRDAETRLSAVIAKKFGLATLEPGLVRAVDVQIAANERDCLFPNQAPGWNIEPLDGVAAETFNKYLRAEDCQGSRGARGALAPPLARILFWQRAKALYTDEELKGFG